jgi:hypothetical protein
VADTRTVAPTAHTQHLGGGPTGDRAKSRRSSIADNKQYTFRMQVAGESVFEVYRFGWDPKGYHDEPKEGARSDSLNASFLGERSRLQLLCSMVETTKTMLFTKPSDLVTVRLVELYLQKQKLDHVFFTVNESVNKGRTTRWVASLFMKNVSIANLKTRQQIGWPGVLPIVSDLVTLEADELFNRSYDSEGNPELKGWEK